jgi:hypothetical protein
MKWLPGHRRQAKEPQQQPANRDEQMREAFSPWAAGLTDDKAMSWRQFLHAELGDEPGPRASVPALREPAEGHRLGELNLVSIPFPGDGRFGTDTDLDTEAG